MPRTRFVNMSRQPVIGKFGFTKSIEHRRSPALFILLIKEEKSEQDKMSFTDSQPQVVSSEKKVLLVKELICYTRF